MNVYDDFIIDCSAASAVERFEKEILTVDSLPLEYIAKNFHAEFVDWSDGIGKIGVDLPSPEFFPEAEIPGHPLSGSVEWTNSRKEFERDLLSLDPGPAVNNVGKPQSEWFESRSARPSAFLTSVLVHCSFFFLIALFPAPQVAGTPGYAGNVLSATIVAHEDLIPQNESPASVDSVASMPSIAKKSREPKKPHSVEPPKATDVQEKAQRTGMAMLEKPDLLERKEVNKEREEVANEKADHQGDGLRDSLASMPSTASAERRFIPAAGQGGEAFDSLVLSAIREAIFFPRQAVRERKHGEVVVAFAINKDRSVLSLGIMRSSGLAILDEAAIKIIQKAAKKFPPFPEGLSTDTLRYVVPILFKEKG